MIKVHILVNLDFDKTLLHASQLLEYSYIDAIRAYTFINILTKPEIPKYIFSYD